MQQTALHTPRPDASVKEMNMDSTPSRTSSGWSTFAALGGWRAGPAPRAEPRLAAFLKP
jgi:hypothetical protein